MKRLVSASPRLNCHVFGGIRQERAQLIRQTTVRLVGQDVSDEGAPCHPLRAGAYGLKHGYRYAVDRDRHGFAFLNALEHATCVITKGARCDIHSLSQERSICATGVRGTVVGSRMTMFRLRFAIPAVLLIGVLAAPAGAFAQTGPKALQVSS